MLIYSLRVSIKGWDVIKMMDKDIPGGNCIREKLFLYLFDLHIIVRSVSNVPTEQGYAAGR